MKPYLTYHKAKLAITLALQIIYGLLAIAMAVALSEVVDAVSNAKMASDLLRAGVFAAILTISFVVSRALAETLRFRYAHGSAAMLRRDLMRAIFSMDEASFAERDSGEYMNRMTGDVQIVFDQYFSLLPEMLSLIVQVIACVVYAVYLDPWIALLLIVMSAVQYIVPSLYGTQINRATVVQSEENGKLTSKIKELLLGFSVLRAFGAEARAQSEFSAGNDSLTVARKKTATLQRVMMCTNLLIAWTMVLGSVFLSGYYVMRGQMTVGTLFAVFYLANRFSMPVMDFAAYYTLVRSSKQIRKKLIDFIKEHPVQSPKDVAVAEDSMELKHVSFAYANGIPVINEINYRFEFGKKYLLLGDSGCGKSTLLKLLSGGYPAEGVFYGGREIKSDMRAHLIGRVILAGQKPYLFTCSIRNNIDIGLTSTDDEVRSCAIDCQLGDLIQSLPEGMNTLVDEEVSQLSGGQKARIGLARAICAKPRVLLLDEVTAALDPETALVIEEMILCQRDMTVIHVSHKPSPSLITRYDEVLRMQNGKLIRER